MDKMDKKKKKQIPFHIVATLLVIGFILGLITYFPSSIIENVTAVVYKVTEGENYYPDVNWRTCPRDMEITAYHLKDTNVYTNANGVLIKHTSLRYAAPSGSMIPMITGGTRLISENYKDQELNVGMVVIFKPAYTNIEDKDTKNIVHRIVKIEDDIITTKGDANNICEVWDREQVNVIIRGVIF